MKAKVNIDEKEKKSISIYDHIIYIFYLHGRAFISHA